MARRPPARPPGRGSWEAGYPDACYPGGWYLDGAEEYRDGRKSTETARRAATGRGTGAIPPAAPRA
jgi:hypothetical protein